MPGRPFRARTLPLVFAVAFALVGGLVPHVASVSLRWSVLAAAVGLLCWYVALLLESGSSGFRIEIAIRKQHWIQACAHTSIFLYWGTEWPRVYEWAPLIVAQLLFAYTFDMLLAWSRRGVYVLGFGIFPIIGSINLFLWFKPDWFYLQLAMVAVGILAKEFIRWEKNGQHTHVFNPSSFPLAIFSLALLATGSTDITWGYDVALLVDAPYMYWLIFLVALPGQFFFGVTTMTMSAVGATYLFSLVYYHATGTYFFPDTFVPIAVFLGMHLLFTDPSTAPRTDLGRVAFGILYAASVIVLFIVLERWGMPSFYDKLLGVPILNLMIQAIDRAAQSRALRWLDPAVLLSRLRPSTDARGALSSVEGRGRQKNLAVMSIWCCGFIGASLIHINMPEADGTTMLHNAVQDDRVSAVRVLLLAGADTNVVDSYGTTALSRAATNGNGPIIRALVRAGADPNSSRTNGLTMLMLAARAAPSGTQALLEAGASVNARDPIAGETALMWATRAGKAETVSLLVRAGADVNAQDAEGRTALTLAASNGDTALVRLLLDRGADARFAAIGGHNEAP